jgi:biopolymer transport protein ExbB
VFDVFANIRDFLEVGGPVVQLLLVMAIVLWAMIWERFFWIRREMPRVVDAFQRRWDARADHASWRAKAVKRKYLSEFTRELRGSMPMIKAVVAIASLTGLLGTVTGMIQVFEVMSSVGTGNARAMAAGVAAATLPTMAGMVVALSGMYWVYRFEQALSKESRVLHDHMITH